MFWQLKPISNPDRVGAILTNDSLHSEGSANCALDLAFAGVPFAELIAPFCWEAAARLTKRLGAKNGHMMAISFKDFNAARSAQSVGSDVQRLIAPLLLQRFQAYRPDRINSAPEIFDGEDLYNAFVENFLAGELEELINEHALVFDLVKLLLDSFAENTLSILTRFSLDELELRQTFNCPDFSKENLYYIKSGYSDRHHHGSTVCVLHFRDGKKLVYKPRDISTEQLFFSVLEFLNDGGFPHNLALLKTLNRRDYGWVEFIEADCQTDQYEAQRYYYRCGALICASHILAMTDCHNGNLIAHGEYPYLLDAETIGHPEPRYQSSKFWNGSNEKRFRNSVIRTGFLPYWKNAKTDGQRPCLEQAGLVNPSEILWRANSLSWENIGKDGIYCVKRPSSSSDTKNLPHDAGGNRYEPTAYADHISNGFENAWQIYSADSQTLELEVEKVLSGTSVRFIFRDTDFYQAAINEALEQAEWKNRQEWDACISRLSMPFKKNPKLPRKILSAETKALSRYDIPRFTVPFGSRVEMSEFGSSFVWELSDAPQSLISERLINLNSSELRYQLTTLRRSLEILPMRAARAQMVSASSSERLNPTILKHSDVARNIGRELVKHAAVQDQHIGWIAPVRAPGIDRFNYRPIGLSLYDGKIGIAVFFSTLFKELREDCFREHALSIADDVVSFVDRTSGYKQRKFGKTADRGMANGIAGIVYSLASIGVLLREHRYIEFAHELAHQLTKRDTDEEPIGILHGLSGDILSLLAISKVSTDDEMARLADILGEQLLETTNWLNRRIEHREKKYIGFAHGLSGVGQALHQLSIKTGNNNYSKRASLCLDYEMAYWGDTLGNTARNEAFANRSSTEISWCNGFSGAALLASQFDEEVKSRLVRSKPFHQLKAKSINGNDSICCGRFGHLLILDELSKNIRSERLEINTFIKGKLSASSMDDLRFMNSPFPCSPPGLFCGLAGVGLALLQIGSGKPGSSLIKFTL